MKDENIKEILDKLKNGFCSALTYEKLLDYITNLREENKKKDAKLQVYLGALHREHELTHKVNDLQEENERLKEELQQEKKDFKETNDYCFELKNYKSRNEKAIEYNKQIIKALLTCTSYEKDKVEDMLYEQQNILEGEDKDVKD